MGRGCIRRAVLFLVFIYSGWAVGDEVVMCLRVGISIGLSFEGWSEDE